MAPRRDRRDKEDSHIGSRGNSSTVVLVTDTQKNRVNLFTIWKGWLLTVRENNCKHSKGENESESRGIWIEMESTIEHLWNSI